MERVLFEKGKQRELIESTKNRMNLTWKKFSILLRIGENYLRNEIRNEQRTLSLKIYEKICRLNKTNYNIFIIKKLDSNWGQIKGGKSVKKRKNLFKKKPNRILCKPSKELAEIIGIMLGDGSIYTIPEKSIYQVHIAGNINDEKDYLLKYVKPLFENVFNLKMNEKRTGNALYVWKQSKELVYTLKRYGLPAGNKKLNGVKIPYWISSNNIFLKACLRGLFDTDGCVYPKNKTNKYPTIWISSAIPTLRYSITVACKKLGINISKWKENRNDAYIDRRDDTLKFLKEIKFNNPKHKIRWSRFMSPSSSPVKSNSRS